MININKANDSLYMSKVVDAIGNKYSIMQAIGRFNYVSISKVTNNPFGGFEGNFKDFDEATVHYKSADIKTALLMAELDFKETAKNEGFL